MEKQLNEIDGEMKTTGWVWRAGDGGAVTLEGFWIWLSVYPCLRTSWRHKCQLWAVCGLPTKLLARSNPDWFYLLDSWHATCEPWPSMCHSNAMASQPPLTSALMDIRVSIFFLHFSLISTGGGVPYCPGFQVNRIVLFFFSLVFFSGFLFFGHICICQIFLFQIGRLSFKPSLLEKCKGHENVVITTWN